MARYFKYKSADDLAADAAERGVPIDLSEDLEPLFAPLDVPVPGGSLRTVGNRLAVQPMEGCDGTPDGRPDELTYRRYCRFGAGGAKLIWGEATAVADDGRMNPRQLWLADHSASEIADMLSGCREEHRAACGEDGDLLVGLQLTHSGRYSFRGPLIPVRDPLLDPRTVNKSTGGPIADDFPILSDDDLRRIQDQFVTAATLAREVGCDFVDIKQCHKYLLCELLAATNRPGNYGGSYENRTRFIRELIGRIREEVPGLLIASRFNAYDGVPFHKGADGLGEPDAHATPLTNSFGTDAHDHAQLALDEPRRLAADLAAWGVSLLNVSSGNPYACPHLVRPAENPPTDGYHQPEHPLVGIHRHFALTAAVQEAAVTPQGVRVPVVGSGYSWLQDYAFAAAAANVAAGRCDVVGYGRGSLSHPDFARSLRESGALNRKQVCRTFSYCTNIMRTKDHPLGQYPTGCPPFDREVYDPIYKEVKAKLAGS
ncbi:oxidoreductase [Alienimonas californiensis]|uniref:NADPH dehydrogenase n=1 Tax=Alienimonas californiensis TaxID=2527989 RepID=A0A517PDG9_9PLAN|nr:NADH:flavin oxidoreductase [Alienimonas californiensis]QDT17419.1 NADPH dehydrogenase [Alienimonas californiensis]